MAEIVINNFTRGKLDHDLNGRFDLPFYQNGFEVCRNFYSNYKGNIKFRPGFEFVSKVIGTGGAAYKEFRFNTEQSYLLEFSYHKLRFYTYDANGNFGYVLDNSNNILEIATTFQVWDAEEMSFAQNGDVMYMTSKTLGIHKLTRTSANSFTLTSVSISAIPTLPAAVCFYSGRLWFAGFASDPLKVVASKVADYENFTIPSSNITDEDPLALTLAEITDPIEWITGGRQNLYVGNAEGISVVNGGSYDTPITSTAVNAALGNHEGASSAKPIVKDNQFYYIATDKRKVFMFDFDLLTEKFVATDLNWMAQEITRGKLKKIVYKRDNNYNIYAVTEDYKLVALLYNQAENILGWFEIETTGQVVDIQTVVRPDGRDDLFICVRRFSTEDMSLGGKYYLERLADEVEFTPFYETKYFLDDADKAYYNRLIAEELKKCRYLDNCQTFKFVEDEPINISIGSDGTGTIQSPNNIGIFDAQYIGHNIVIKTKTGKEYGTFRIDAVPAQATARVTMLSNGYYVENNSGIVGDWADGFYITFTKISNLNDLNGKTVKVVADGGYLGDYVVTNNELVFDREIANATIGIGYMGLLKTFNIGDYMGGRNYQTAPKRIAKVIMRFVYSAGVEVGTALNTLKEVQYFAPTGFYDLPPLPMDGDERRSIPDTIADWKELFVVQGKPLPVNLTMIQYNTEFGG
jgi:hypothetical protein